MHWMQTGWPAMSDTAGFMDIVDGFVTEKRAVGYKFRKEELLLRHIVKLHASMSCDPRQLTKELVLKYAEKHIGESDGNRFSRIGVIRGLAQYMQRLGMDAYVFPYRSVPYTSSGFSPHIFSNDELRRLFEATDHAKESPYTPFKNMQFALLLRMLYSTGMRVGEIATLKKADIDLAQGLIRIRHAKFDKERTIPVAESLLERMRQYDNRMRFYPIWEQTEYFWANTVGNPYDTTTIYHCFREYLRKAGISHGGKGVGPRLHDIRHTYAVHCLRNWVRDGRDLTAALPYLAVYMGHVGVRCTQYYLRLTAELYPDIVMKLDDSYSWMIPEVGTV